ncbi:MAG: hypothetical protein P9G45_13710 [Candidatus Contendobacter sp.]|nr:hypothetical protein [Candidatus Contendobacter sp.]
MNPVPPTSPLHPSLQKLDVIGCRRGLLMLLVLLGTCYGQITGWDFCSLILLLLVVLISLKMMPVSSRALNAANRLLRDCVPQTFRLTLIDILDEHKLAVLYPLAARSPAEPVYALIDRSFPRNPPLGQEVEVRVYCREPKPGNELVALQSDGVPLLGKVIDRTAYDRQQRMLRIAALIVLGTVLVGMLVFMRAGGSPTK